MEVGSRSGTVRVEIVWAWLDDDRVRRRQSVALSAVQK
jgi:hypothetical protein